MCGRGLLRGGDIYAGLEGGRAVPRLEKVDRASSKGNVQRPRGQAHWVLGMAWQKVRASVLRELLHALAWGEGGGCVGEGEQPQPGLLSGGQAVPLCVPLCMPRAAVPQPMLPRATSGSGSGSPFACLAALGLLTRGNLYLSWFSYILPSAAAGKKPTAQLRKQSIILS